MVLEQSQVVRGAVMGAGLLAIVSGGFAIATPNGPARMSELRLQGAAGYEVLDSRKEHVGRVTRIEADRTGRTRYIHIALDGGGEVKVASFRAYFNARQRQIELMLPQDILFARAEATAEPAPTAPSV